MTWAWNIASEACQRWHAEQRVDELASVLLVVEEVDPKVIVEIGCGFGGTLWAWRAAFPTAAVFGVSLETHGPIADHGATVLIGDSRDRATRQRLVDQLGGRDVDVLFIDGDHSRDGIRSDWRMYAPLVRAGGLILFHDVANLLGEPQAVDAWEEMKADTDTFGEPVMEITSRAHRPLGFGILRAQGDR